MRRRDHSHERRADGSPERAVRPRARGIGDAYAGGTDRRSSAALIAGTDVEMQGLVQNLTAHAAAKALFERHPLRVVKPAECGFQSCHALEFFGIGSAQIARKRLSQTFLLMFPIPA